MGFSRFQYILAAVAVSICGTIALANPTPPATPQTPPTSGDQNGQCPANGEKLPLQEPAPEFQKGQKQAFIDWLLPTAKYIESKTGLPAGLLMSQAALETGWGTSKLFKEGNGLFGHSCFTQATTQSGQTKLGDKTVPWTAECTRPRPAAEGGKYLTFPTKSDSILAYTHLLLQKGTYARLQALVRGVTPPNAPPLDQAIDAVASRFNPNSNYAQKVKDVARSGIIAALERGNANQQQAQNCDPSQTPTANNQSGAPQQVAAVTTNSTGDTPTAQVTPSGAGVGSGVRPIPPPVFYRAPSSTQPPGRPLR